MHDSDQTPKPEKDDLSTLTETEDPKYPLSEDEETEVLTRFTYHAPKDDQPKRYSDLRRRGRRLAFAIMEQVPPSRERSLALTNLEEAIMWANAGIARNE